MYKLLCNALILPLFGTLFDSFYSSESSFLFTFLFNIPNINNILRTPTSLKCFICTVCKLKVHKTAVKRCYTQQKGTAVIPPPPNL